ncbi:MAG: NAD(P)-dependent dehydrogenase (short-subunit alcohol dehydrogenase family) [Candidatus Midichloriaceae bacterium]|jgi:NAD(P)-dependent dehydrogenase (short-subunit alcohol dehydrogenase family)
MTLDNILIIGANRGLGFGLLKEMLTQKNTANIIATYRNPESSVELINLSKENENLNLLNLEITDQNSIIKLKDNLAGKKIDHLIINSGILIERESSIEQVTQEDLMKTFNTNVVGPLMLLQNLIDVILLSDKKVVMIMSSIAGSISSYTTHGRYSYRTSKAALNASMKIASIELKGSGVKLLMMHPGWVKTDMGGNNALIEIDESVKGMVEVLKNATNYETGSFVDYLGNKLEW